MKSSLRIAAAVGLMTAAACAGAQDYPAKPIRLISAWTPGGANDILARALGQAISQRFGQPVVIENRPGASGTIGTAHVAQSPADGYTITLGSMPSYSTAPSMFPDLRYDPIKDLTPIAFVAIVPNVLVVNPSLPVKSVPELLAYAKANPGKLAFSSVGNGSSSHLGGELFKLMGHVDMTHVPYKGTAPALVDLVGGRVQLAFENINAAPDAGVEKNYGVDHMKVVEGLGCKAIRVHRQEEMQPAIRRAEELMAEHQVPVVIEVMLERVTNIAMGTEIDAINEFEPLAEDAADAPTAIAAAMLD